MTSPRPIARLSRLFKRSPALPAEVLDPYTATILPVLDRAEALYQGWFEHTALVADSEKLANAAAIHRWQAATMARSLERVPPPGALVETHQDLIASLHQASRAAQLLSSGSRYHSANAVCEGQVLLADSRARRQKVAGELRRVMARRRPPSAQPTTAAERTPMEETASSTDSVVADPDNGG